MTTYVYKNAAGERVERFFDMGTAPEALTVEGVPYELTVSGGRPPIVKGSKPVKGYSLPWKGDMTPDQRAAVARSGGSFDSEGVPCWETQERADRFCGITQAQVEASGEGEFWTTGDGPTGAEMKNDKVRYDG